MKLSVKKRFFKFLKDERIWNLYWDNVKEYNKFLKRNNIYFESERKISNPHHFICRAFNSTMFNSHLIYRIWGEYAERWEEVLRKENY